MKSLNLLPSFILIIFQLTTSQGLLAQNGQFDIVNFNDPNNVVQLLADSTTGDWQIGEPQKDFFGSAYSQPNAIMTDTVQPFTADIRSSFILKFSNSDTLNDEVHYSGTICFYHKLESEAGVDFAQVAVSTDQGNFWSDFTTDMGGWNVTQGNGTIEYSSDFYNNWHFDGNDSLYGFTGVIDEYRHTCMNICWISPVISGGLRSYPPDSIWVKFSFLAGPNAAQNAGWIIDDVTYDYYDCGTGLNELDLPPLKVYPQPASERLQFYKPENTSSQAHLHIFNAVGQIVKVIPYENEELSIDVQNWSSGLYTYILYDKEGPVNIGKIIVSR